MNRRDCANETGTIRVCRACPWGLLWPSRWRVLVRGVRRPPLGGPCKQSAFLVTDNREDARDAVQDALIGLYPRWEQVEGGAEAHARRRILNANVSRCRKFGAEALPFDPDITRAGPSSPFAAVDDNDAAARLFARCR